MASGDCPQCGIPLHTVKDIVKRTITKMVTNQVTRKREPRTSEMEFCSLVCGSSYQLDQEDGP